MLLTIVNHETSHHIFLLNMHQNSLHFYSQLLFRKRSLYFLRSLAKICQINYNNSNQVGRFQKTEGLMSPKITIENIAREANVSIATVSLSLIHI